MMKKRNCEKEELCKYCALLERAYMQKEMYIDLYRAYEKEVNMLLARHPELEDEWDEIVSKNKKN